MKLQHLAFLIGGLFYGALLSFAALWVIDRRPEPDATGLAAPAAMAAAAPVSTAPTQGGEAPMMAQIGELKRRVEANPQDRDALLRLGEIYSQAGMWSESSTFFDQAAALEPGDRDLVVRLGNFHYDRAQWSLAVGWYDRALELAPDDPNVLTDRGYCLRKLGDGEGALASFARANEIDPSHWKSLYNTVVVAGLELGRFDEARDALAKLEANSEAEGVQELRRELERVAGTAAENPS